MVCFLKLTADQMLVFDCIAGSCQVNLLKTGQNYSEAGFLTFSSRQMFFAALFCLYGDH